MYPYILMTAEEQLSELIQARKQGQFTALELLAGLEKLEVLYGVEIFELTQAQLQPTGRMLLVSGHL